MISRFSPAAVFAAALLMAGPVSGAEYPFSGFFTFPPDDAAAEDAHLFCAFSHFVQNTDGSFVNYHIDLPRYEKEGTIRYLVLTRGQCSVDDSAKVETCTTHWDADREQVGESLFDAIRKIGPAAIELDFFDSAADAKRFVATGSPAPAAVATYYRCPFDADGIRKFRSEEESKVTTEERQRLVEPELNSANRATMTRLLAAIRAGQ